MTGRVAVLGIDCASSESAVFDGNCFEVLRPTELDQRLASFEQENDIGLVCWDAPLTGPPSTDKIWDSDGAYSMRRIERFCNPARKGSPLWGIFGDNSAPSGVNTRGYSGMSHWAVTQALTGHPRINSRYLKRPRFPLLAESLDADGGFHRAFEITDVRLAEVHPAVALWLWVEPHLKEEDRGDPARFEYKKGNAIQKRERTGMLAEQLLRSLEERLGRHGTCGTEHGELIYGSLGRDGIFERVGCDHNRLDAYVAWVLGRLAVACSDEVIQLGSIADGAFLLPLSEKLQDAWTSFTREG